MSILQRLRPVADLRVLVTAGAGGIGAVVARALHAAGARVHVCDVDRAALDRMASQTRGITGSMADVSVANDVDQVFEDVKGALGGLDVLISNAGTVGPTGPIESISSTGWERTVAVNLDSQYYFARRAVPLLKASAHGASLIAVGSAAAGSGDPYRTPYVSTRWAVVGLVKSLAVELAPQRVRVNAILPGERENSALRRKAMAEDVAAMAMFLCSPAARSVTGQAITLDGSPEHP
jgi:NAD(P)-dependent dehydrogenase (short-subunit alcohol dehydrogenase family)